jgi:hypothetical protein
MRLGVLAAILAALLAVPANAEPKERALQRRAAEPPARQSSEPPSLDGRVTGHPRTCGFDTFVYSPSGGTMGPYCH